MTAYEERLGLDELRRAHALDKAIETVGLDETADDILDRARKFEDYLKKEVRADEPEPEPAVEVLPRPKQHDVNSKGKAGCRRCRWDTLKEDLNA